ncbi:MAG: hypothetical protein QM581_03405 [Pseudomonas sp.]
MLPRDLNKEAFLWYTMTSPEYMDRSYEKLTEVANYLRERIKEHSFIMDYAPVPRWLGEMEKLEASYANARAMLVHGEFSFMSEWVATLQNIPRGFSESSMSWMPLGQQKEFERILDEAYGIASDYMSAITMSGRHFRDPESDWRQDHDAGFSGSNILYGWESVAGDLMEIPEYVADNSITVVTGELVPWTGVWVPAEGAGSAALAFARQGQIMQPAYEVVSEDEESGYVETRPVDVAWHPFRPTGNVIPLNDRSVGTVIKPERVYYGEHCPLAGWWYTPAKADSRRYFKQGEVFPKIEGSDYGDTFWLWSQDQTSPAS